MLGEEHPDTLTSAGNLATYLSCQGKHTDAERIHREVLGLKRRVLGEGHPSTLAIAANLAASLLLQRKHAEAEGLLQATLEAYRRVLGIDHPDTLRTAQSLENVRSAMRAEEPTTKGGKAATRRIERASAPALSPTALAEAEAKAWAAVAELLAMLDLEEPAAGAGGRSGSPKGKTRGNAKDKAKGKGGKVIKSFTRVSADCFVRAVVEETSLTRSNT